MPAQTKFSIDATVDLLRRLSSGVIAKPLHRIFEDASESYCYDCCVKAAGDTNRIDGGWVGLECDGQEFCATCGQILDCAYTDYGVETEIDAISDLDKLDATNAYIALQIIDCGVPRLTETCGDYTYRRDLLPKVKKIFKLAKAALKRLPTVEGEVQE